MNTGRTHRTWIITGAVLLLTALAGCQVGGIDRAESDQTLAPLSLAAQPPLPQESCSEPLPFGIPTLEETDQLLCKTGFVVAWDPDLKVPDWVGFELTREEASADSRRLGSFSQDTSVEPGSRLRGSAYEGSGYDRGHMASAADMSFSDDALRDSFQMSNVAPQIGISFNRHIWKRLEAEMRGWARDRGRVYILVGPAFLEGTPDRMGADQIAVPSHYWRIAIDAEAGDAAAFILPNRQLSTRDLPRFTTTVDVIEAAIGIDLMPELPDALAPMEATEVSVRWGTDNRLIWP